MALHPNFPATPYVYVLYAHDAAIGGTAPRWGTPASPPTRARPRPARPPTAASCAAGSRGFRPPATSMTGAEQVLIEDWCQQFPSHSIGSLAFGADGALYVTRRRRRELQLHRLRPGRQPGQPVRRPARRAGHAPDPPTAEGGALRSQDVRTTGDPTGARRHGPPPRPGHRRRRCRTTPTPRSADPNARRIVAYGLRNPFRITIRPGTSEVWVGDVGWNDVGGDQPRSTRSARPCNFGWPCYEGAGRQSGYDGAEPDHLREPLHGRARPARAPLLRLRPRRARRARRDLPDRAARRSPAWPSTPATAALPGRLRRRAVLRRLLARLHLGDARRRGRPARRRAPIATFAAGAANPVDLSVGPAATSSTPTSTAARSAASRYTAGNQAAHRGRAARRRPPAPRRCTVAFDGTGSIDPDGDTPQLRLGPRRRRRLRRLLHGHAATGPTPRRARTPRGCG